MFFKFFLGEVGCLVCCKTCTTGLVRVLIVMILYASVGRILWEVICWIRSVFWSAHVGLFRDPRKKISKLTRRSNFSIISDTGCRSRSRNVGHILRRKISWRALRRKKIFLSFDWKLRHPPLTCIFIILTSSRMSLSSSAILDWHLCNFPWLFDWRHFPR